MTARGPRVIVIGAGIVGAAVAYGLATRGAAVTVLEAGRPAGGTSANSFAWANANNKPPAAYHALNAAGLAGHHRLREKLGPGGFHPSGHLEVALGPVEAEALRQKVARLRAADYRAEWIDPAQARALVPDLVLPADPTILVVQYPEEGWVAAPVLVGQLLAAATAAGATVRYPAPVTALTSREDRVTGVTVGAETLPADWVIDCAGPAAGTLLAPLGRQVARRRSPGLLLVSEPLPLDWRPVVHVAGLHLRPDGAGRVRFGAADVDDRLPPDGTVPRDSPLVVEVQRRAAAVVPLLADATIEAVRVGWRPLPADGLSAVGPVLGVPGYYLVFTHSGVTLAPILGDLVAEEIVLGQPRPELTPFRPDRLLTPAD
jgi:glycine/D-amino acid oxidase-like deaminating enzyme